MIPITVLNYYQCRSFYQILHICILCCRVVQCNFDTLVNQQDQITQQIQYEHKINCSSVLKSLARSGMIIYSHKIYHCVGFIAFQSYTCAYMAYPVDMRSIFKRQHLHLGHIATSFGLKEIPTMISRRTKIGTCAKKKWRRSTKKYSLRRKPVFEY